METLKIMFVFLFFPQNWFQREQMNELQPFCFFLCKTLKTMLELLPSMYLPTIRGRFLLVYVLCPLCELHAPAPGSGVFMADLQRHIQAWHSSYSILDYFHFHVDQGVSRNTFYKDGFISDCLGKNCFHVDKTSHVV